MPRLKNNLVSQKNATVTTIFGLKNWWLTVPPPGGGGPKLIKSIENKIKRAIFPLPLPKFAKKVTYRI